MLPNIEMIVLLFNGNEKQVRELANNQEPTPTLKFTANFQKHEVPFTDLQRKTKIKRRKEKEKERKLDI